MSCESVESSTTLSSPRQSADDVNMEIIEEQEEKSFVKSDKNKESLDSVVPYKIMPSSD